MMDDFLYKFRKEPGDKFTIDLYARISKGVENSSGVNYVSNVLRVMILVLLLIVLVGCSYLVISPAARAKVLDQIRQIAGVSYNETPKYPELEPEQIVPIQYHVVRLSEAQDSLPFQISLPTWIPDGYSLLEEQVMYYSYDQESADLSKAYNVYLNWTKDNVPGNGNIVLVEQPIFRLDQYEDNMMPVGQDSLSEVKIGELVGALIRGSWNPETNLWDIESGQIALRWTKGNMHYLLTSNERYVELEDLIKMAESIQ